jgi:hypothetical protein
VLVRRRYGVDMGRGAESATPSPAPGASVDHRAIVAVAKTGPGGEVMREAELYAGEPLEPVYLVSGALDRERTEVVLDLAAAGTRVRTTTPRARCEGNQASATCDEVRLGRRRRPLTASVTAGCARSAHSPGVRRMRRLLCRAAGPIGAVSLRKKPAAERSPSRQCELERPRHREELTSTVRLHQTVRDLHAANRVQPRRRLSVTQRRRPREAGAGVVTS